MKSSPPETATLTLRASSTGALAVTVKATSVPSSTGDDKATMETVMPGSGTGSVESSILMAAVYGRPRGLGRRPRQRPERFGSP